jgi:alpha-L-fucosidase
MPQPFSSPAFNERVYELQPQILLNERNGPPFDFRNSEQVIAPQEGAWEACMTLNDNWGYFADQSGYKSPAEVRRMLLMCAKDGGNLLLNVGPQPDGVIPPQSVEVLEGVGNWLQLNGEWLYGSERSSFAWCEANCWLSVKGKRIYVHLLRSPGGNVCIGEIKNEVLSATRLDSGEPVRFEQRGDRLFLCGLPPHLDNTMGIVIALDVLGKPESVGDSQSD